MELDAIIGWIVAAAGVIGTYIKNKDLKAALQSLLFTDPYNTEVTTATDQKYLPDGSWKMGDEQRKEIFEELSTIEINALESVIFAMESQGLQKYELKTSKGTYTIENGYIEKRPASNTGTWQVIQDADGRRIGDLDILGINQSMGYVDTVNTLKKSENKIIVHGKWTNYGSILIGVKVGDEGTQTIGLDSDTSQEFETIQPLEYKLWNYSKTLIVGKPVNVTIYKGYKRENALGHPVPEWTWEKTYTFDVVE